MKKAWQYRVGPSNLAVRGAGHPRSRRVLTPDGEFGSAALAADHFGIDRATAARKAHRGIDGWLWLEPRPADRRGATDLRARRGPAA